MLKDLSIAIALAAITVSFCFCIPESRSENPKRERTATIGFYNVENLFDTIDDPLIDDNEFLPAAEKQWNTEKYMSKLERLASVIAKLGDKLPAVVGLCEIENAGVIVDLIAQPALKDGKYALVHVDSPDQRGIDVGLIYSTKLFEATFHKRLHVEMPPGERPTRDILYVKGKMNKGPELHIFVNHWPSRYGGEEVSEPKRLAAARVLKNSVDSLLAIDANAAIICVGDFNDYPTNRSIAELLDARTSKDPGLMVDLMNGLEKTKRGSYNYKGDWGFLDQIIVSRALLNNSKPFIKTEFTQPYFRDEMIYIDEKYGDEKPSRTFGGPEYYGGFSDHLPVYTILAY